MGLEPMTSSLPRTRSTAELQQPAKRLRPIRKTLYFNTARAAVKENPRPGPAAPPRRPRQDGAGDGNRTHTTGLEGQGSTVELRPLAPFQDETPARRRFRPARGGNYRGGEKRIRTSEGLSQQIYSLPPLAAWVSPHFLQVELAVRIELTTFRLQGGCSTVELRQHEEAPPPHHFTTTASQIKTVHPIPRIFRLGREPALPRCRMP